MNRPSFQFYPADWRNNANLRRCTEAARGAWMEVLCVLHDSDDYGICRWPLVELARAAGVPIKLLKELADKKVLKGGDANAEAYTYTTRHAGQDGETHILIPASVGPCWYSSRMVRDEWVRNRRGANTRFDAENQPPSRPPTRRVGERQGATMGSQSGDGPSSSSSSSSSSIQKNTPKAPRKRGAEVTIDPSAETELIRERMLAINRLVSRRPATRWSAKEYYAFTAQGLDQCTAEDFAAQLSPLEAFYCAPHTPDPKDKNDLLNYRRSDLGTLLNHWAGEIDKANRWAALGATASRGDDVPGFDPSLPNAHTGGIPCAMPTA